MFAGLKRCGKSCRLRWTNYLRPDIKRGRFSFEEDRIIIQLHAILGNRWSAIASHLPRRTDNEIKNYWNTHLKKRLTQMGIDPVTHQKKSSTDVPPAAVAAPPWTPLHMTQWDLAHTNPFLRPFTTPPPAAAWKAKPEEPKFRPVKVEPQYNILQRHWGGSGPESMVLGGASMAEQGSEIFVGPSDNIYPGTVIGGFQNQPIAASPTSILHGPDSDATTSPCETASDCFDLILSSFQSFAGVSGQEPSCVVDTFWQRQQAAMVEAMRPDSCVLGDGASQSGLEMVDFNGAEFSQFEILCQGEQYQGDCVLEC
jgi:hypothetical protein